MKRIALLVTLGVSCFLAGVLATALWFYRQSPPATPGVTDSGPDATFGEGNPNGGQPTGGGNHNARSAKFAALDTDQDGRLSLTEFGAGRSPAEAAKWFGRRDADRDGFLSKQEFLPASALSEGR